MYFDRVVPLVGSLLSDRKAYSYLPESAVYLPPWKSLRSMLENAGFSAVERESAMLGAVQIVTAVRGATSFTASRPMSSAPGPE